MKFAQLFAISLLTLHPAHSMDWQKVIDGAYPPHENDSQISDENLIGGVVDSAGYLVGAGLGISSIGHRIYEELPELEKRVARQRSLADVDEIFSDSGSYEGKREFAKKINRLRTLEGKTDLPGIKGMAVQSELERLRKELKQSNAYTFYQQRLGEILGSDELGAHIEELKANDVRFKKRARLGVVLIGYSVLDFVGRLVASGAFDRDSSVVPLASLTLGAIKEAELDLPIPTIKIEFEEAQ